jgi:hypothetical protein
MKSRRHEKRKVTAWLDRAMIRQRSAATKAAVVLIVAGAAAWPAPSSAQATICAELRMTELEKGFRVCDHAATIGRIDASTAMTCRSLTEALKQRKSDGDFNAMLAWWRQHKAVEHLVLAKAGGTSLSPLAPTAPR